MINLQSTLKPRTISSLSDHSRLPNPILYQNRRHQLKINSMSNFTSLSTRNGAQIQQGGAKTIKKDLIYEGKFLKMMQIDYVKNDQEEKVHKWESVERTTQILGSVDAVAMFTVMKKAGEEPKVMLVKQFRPPAGKYTIEMPAGLVDPGESVQEAGLRELKEETGYSGKVIQEGPCVCYQSPGLTNESIKVLFVMVDLDAPENQNVQQDQEDAEVVEVLFVPIDGILDSLKQLQDEGCGIYTGLYFIAQGMSMTTAMFE
eukprot:TRINITY_DN918_c0_g1_i7.p1 TRINITY_DN918_c0_g1~~TRINITY_DN918_c0_g1_i7.p1  ORF type:complete len:259 (-),score=24.38 TRINITY_DN918_c0_g1_i7:224-1000(-)